MEIVSQLVQQRSETAGLFSSALFCLWLSIASLVVLLDWPLAFGPRDRAAHAADGAPAAAQRPDTEQS